MSGARVPIFVSRFGNVYPLAHYYLCIYIAGLPSYSCFDIFDYAFTSNSVAVPHIRSPAASLAISPILITFSDSRTCDNAFAARTAY
jgi:hypothetical protein